MKYHTRELRQLALGIEYDPTHDEQIRCAEALRECADEIERLCRVEKAARDYYMGFVQDEADDDGVESTGCSETQYLQAQRLRDVLSPNAKLTCRRGVQRNSGQVQRHVNF